VGSGLAWLILQQDPEGCIGSRNVAKYMHNHALAALALSDAYGLTGSNRWSPAGQKAIDFLIAAQNPGSGWRYTYKSGDSDTPVTSCAVEALKSAESSGLSFPRSGYEGSRAWFDEVTDPTTGRAGYRRRGEGSAPYPSSGSTRSYPESPTAQMVLCRIFMDKHKGDRRLILGSELLLRDKPKWEAPSLDFHHWLWSSLALFQFDGPDGPRWKSWSEPLVAALVDHQNADRSRCNHGSWEPIDRWGSVGGRVYAAATNALSLEVYSRYANVFGVK